MDETGICLICPGKKKVAYQTDGSYWTNHKDGATHITKQGEWEAHASLKENWEENGRLTGGEDYGLTTEDERLLWNQIYQSYEPSGARNPFPGWKDK